jgi:hypothetical protein
MSILVPKAHRDGSQLGMHKREWSNILSQNLYSSSSFINGAEITSGSYGLEVDGRPIITSPFATNDISTELAVEGIVGLRLNNLMKPESDYNMDGHTLTNVRTPTSEGEVATKDYVDQNIQGLKWKQSTKISSNLNIVTEDYWTQVNPTLTFTEQIANSNEYILTSGNEGWYYSTTSDVLYYQVPTQISYVRHTNSIGSVPSSTSINTSPASYVYSINGTATFSSADSGDDSVTSHTVNFRELMFDGGVGGNAYGDIEINDRVLIKDATPKTMNGIWYFEHTGSAQGSYSINDPDTQHRWRLKRALDFDRTSEISSAAVFVEEGHKNADHSFVVTTNSSSIGGLEIGNYNVDWTLFGTQQADNITIYKDVTQNSRFEVTGVLRDINDIYYNYSGLGNRINVDVGEFLVGNGTTFVSESGNTARTSLGLGTGDSPTFTNLTLTGGELTASHLVSNSANPIILSSNLSGTVDLTVDNISADGNLSANSIASSTSITAGTTITSTQGITAGNSLTVSAGNLNVAGGNITADAGSISAQFVTASVALSASYIQLFEYSDITTFTNANPTQNSIYVADSNLYFDGTQIAGGGSSGQPKENVLFYGGNLTSDIDTGASYDDNSPTAFYMRMGVSGSHQSAVTNAAGRESYYQILTGSFQELTGTKVDINGGTIDSTVIGGTTPSIGTFTIGTFSTLNTTNANITTAKILGGEVTGSYGKFTVLTGSSVDINNGTIDGTVIGSTSAAAGTFTTLNAITSLEAATADINGGTIDGTVIGSTSAAAGTFSTLTVSTGGTLNSDNVNLTGGFINNVTIGSNSTIQASTVDYGTGSFYTLTASNIVVPQSSESGYLNITVSDASRASTITKSGSSVLNITATKGIFDTLTGSNVKITNANILDGDITGSLGVFSVLTGSSVEITSVDINSGSLDDISIGDDLTSTNHGRFNTLTGSVSYIGNPNNASYESYGRFLTLSASHVEIIDPDSQNRAVFEHLTGSYIEVKNQLSASAGASIGFGGNVIGDLGTPNSSDAHRKAAVNREYIDTVVAIKTSVRLVQNNVIDISIDAESVTPDSVDSVLLSLGDRILLTNQSTASENGIWQVTTGALIRPYDYASGDPAGGYIVLVEEGNSNSQSVYSLKSSGNVDASDVTVTKISSKYGVSTDGKGLKKSVNIFDVDINEGDWDAASPEARANLTFNGTSSPHTNQLILSSSIRVNELKVVNTAGSDGKVQISGSDDSYIDNVKIGMNTPADGKFSSLNISAGNFVLDNATEITASAGSTNTKIGLNEATFNKITIPATFTADNTSASGEDLVNIIGSLKISNTQPSDTTQRLWRDSSSGDLYYENDKIGSGGGTSVGNVTSVKDFTSIYVTGSQSDGHGAYISGTLVVEGDVQIQGSTTTISSSNTTFQDSIIGLGITGSDSSSESFNNLGDRGLIFARSANSYDSLPGMWWDGSKFNFAKSVTSPSSGSFGVVTERSKVNAGIIEATEVTASAGLRINDYNLPTVDGNPNQVIKTDGSGNLSFVNQDGGSNNTLTKIDLTVTTPPAVSLSTKQTFNLNNQIPDLFNIDLSSLNLSDFAPPLSSAALLTRYLTAKFDGLPQSFFVEGRVFYVGVSGLDFTGYQNASPPPYQTDLGWCFDDNDVTQGNVLFITTQVAPSDYVVYTELTDIDGNTNIVSSGNDLDRIGVYRPFSSGEKAKQSGFKSSYLLDRVDTDGNGIFCLKYEFIKANNSGLMLSVDYSKIIYFNKFDVRFS